MEWAAVMSCSQSIERKGGEILLDSGSTHLLTDLRKGKETLNLETNAGTRIISEEAKVPGFRKVLFSPEAITNFFLLNDLMKVNRVAFDSKNSNSFCVNLKDEFKKFFYGNGIYVYHSRENTLKYDCRVSYLTR